MTDARALLPASRFATVRIGSRVFAFTSFEHVSAAYLETIARLDLGVSQTPRCEILASDGKVVAEVSYNGRVWAQSPNGFRDYGECLYDPIGGAEEFVEATLANRARFGGSPFVALRQAA